MVLGDETINHVYVPLLIFSIFPNLLKRACITFLNQNKTINITFNTMKVLNKR